MASDIGPAAVLALTQRALAFWNTYVESLQRRPEGFLRTVIAGEPDWTKLLPYPTLSASEADEVARLTSAFAARSRELTASDSAVVARVLRECGLLGVTASREDGGAGLSTLAAVRIVAAVAETNLSAALVLGAHAFCVARLVEKFAPEETRKAWLSRLATGEALGAYAVSERLAGSDLAMLESVVSDRNGVAVITGEKTLVTSGLVADLAIAAASGFGATDEERSRPSVVLVETTHAGVKRSAAGIWPGLESLGAATLRFDSVPVECLLGGAGEGNAVLTEGLTGVRLAAAAAALGAARSTYQRVRAAVRERKQFGKRIDEFEMCREKLARATAAIEAMEAVVDLTAALRDRGLDCAVEAASAKIFCSRLAAETISALGELEGAAAGRTPSGIESLRWIGGANDVLKLFIVLDGARPVLEFLFRNRAARKGAGWLDATVKKWWRGVRLAHARPKIPGLPASYREPARILSESIGILAERTWQICDFHMNEIVNHQYEVRRLAEMMLEIWPLTAQLLRVAARERGARERGDQPNVEAETAMIALRFRARRTWRRVARWSSQVFLSDDGDVERLAGESGSTMDRDTDSNAKYAS